MLGTKLLSIVLLLLLLGGCAVEGTVRGPIYYSEPDYMYYGPEYVGPPGVVVFGLGFHGRGYYRHRR